MKITKTQLRRIIREAIESEYYVDLKRRTSDKGKIVGTSKQYSDILIDQMDNFVSGIDSDYFDINEISFTAFQQLKAAVKKKIGSLQ